MTGPASALQASARPALAGRVARRSDIGESACDSWRFPIARGLLAIAFGAAASAWTEPSVAFLAIVFGIYCAGDGGVTLAEGLRETSAGVQRSCLVVRGGAGIIVGVISMLSPILSPAVFYGVFVLWLVATGVFAIVAGVAARGRIDGQLFLVLNGVVLAFLGVILLAIPSGGVVAMVPLISAYAVMAGTVLLLLGMRIHVPE